MFCRSVLTRLNKKLVLSTRLNHDLIKSINSTKFGSLSIRTYSKDVKDDDKSNDKNREKNESTDDQSNDDQSKTDLIKGQDRKVKFGDHDSSSEVSIYDTFQTVEEVRSRLIKESEVLKRSIHGLFKYPAGFAYAMKSDRIHDLEKIDIKPFRDLKASSLIQSTVLIIGGGLIGMSIAYWLRELGTDMYDVNLIDRDFKHLYSNTGLTSTGLQQQFSTRECIEASQYSADFLRTNRRYLNVFSKEPPDIDYCPTGNLILAKEDGVQDMLNAVRIQNELGQKTIIMNKEQLQEKFPWLNCDEIEMASMGLENEGHFNSQALLRALKIKAENLHARFWECEFVDFNLHLIDVTDQGGKMLKVERVRRALLRDKGNDLFQVDFDAVVIAAGPENYKFGPLLSMGDPEHPEPSMRFPLPLKKRKRYYYTFQCDEGPSIDFPLLIDSSGVFCRADNFAGRYITGKMPSENEEIDNNNSDVDYRYFEDIIQPVLVKRVPAFRNLELLRGWSCFEDVNTYDGLPIIGEHPFYENVTIVGGLGVHAAALAPAIGKAVAEKLLFDRYRTVDLTRFGWERFFTDYKFETEEKLKF